MQQVIVDFDEAGNPSVSVRGVRGKACKDLTRDLEKDLGSVVSDAHTAEYQQAPTVGQAARAKQGGGS